MRNTLAHDLKLSGLTLIDPGMLTTFFSQSTDIQIERVTVRSRTSTAFGNAFVLAGSRRVSIKDCDVDSKDDCIALMTFHPDWPNEDIEISGAVEQPDARAFIAGDDVQGLTLQGVVARAPAPVPGLVKLAAAEDVTEKDCRVDCGASVPVLVAPTADELRRLAELRTRSAVLDREIQQKADEFDAAARKTSATR